MLGDIKCHCTTLTISHHSSVVKPFRLPSIFAHSVSPKPRSTAQLSMQRLGSVARHTQHCAGVQRATLRQVPLIASAAELRPRLKSHEMSISGIKLSPKNYCLYLTTFLLTFSTILLLKGKGENPNNFVLVTGLLSRFIPTQNHSGK